MIGVDTNVLARFFLKDDPVWTPRAIAFIEDELTPEQPGYVNPLTLAELVWTLRLHSKFNREQMVEVLSDLLAFEKIVVGESPSVARALERYRVGGAGFADYLIAELNSAAGATPTVTIDRKAARREPFHPLQP